MTKDSSGPEVDERIAAAARILSRAYRTMLGFDGTSVEDAARAAYTPTGPPVEEIEERIRERRHEVWGGSTPQ